MGMQLQTNCDPDAVHDIYCYVRTWVPGCPGVNTCGSLVSVDSCARFHVTSVGGDQFKVRAINPLLSPWVDPSILIMKE